MESIYWIELLKETEYMNDYEFRTIHEDATEILKIICSIILTSKNS